MKNLSLTKTIIYIAFVSILFFSEGWAQELGSQLSSKTSVSFSNPKAIPLKDLDSKLTLTVEVSGIEGEILENVSARLKINLRPVHETTTVDDIQNFYQKGPKEIEEALKPFGYFRSKIHSRLVRTGPKDWKIFFQVNLGEPMLLEKAEIHIIGEGSSELKIQKLRTEILKKLGNTLNIKRYEEAKQDLYEFAERRGYFQANVIDSRVKIDMINYKASLYIFFDTGPRYQFGPVIFSSTPLSDRFLQRYVQFKVGEPFSEDKLKKLQKDLTNSNYFQKVSIEQEVGTATKTVPIKVNLQVKKARQYIIGAGWGTDTGFRGIFGINFRRLNPQGHQLKTDAIISEYQKNAKATYIIPGKKPATDQYRISGAITRLTENPGNANNQRVDLSYLTIYKKWSPIFSLGFLNEKFFLRDFPIEQRDTLLIPSFSIGRSWGDDPLKPTKGYQVNFNIRGADKHIVGKHSFSQVRLDVKTLSSITPAQRIILRGSIAKTDIKNIYNLPLSLQYFAGGPQSVRGYGYLDIGPGKYLSVASVEFQQKIKGNFYLAVFYDVGSVSQNFFESLKRSPGVGLVYLSPIGDIEFAIAKPLDRDFPFGRRAKSIRFQFSVGSELFGFNSKD